MVVIEYIEGSYIEKFECNGLKRCPLWINNRSPTYLPLNLPESS